jgi:alpha-galactosidase
MKGILLIVILCFASTVLLAQPKTGLDKPGQVFRLDGGDVSYVFGVNERGELQSVYWGGRLQASDRFSTVKSSKSLSSFESSESETPQEYPGWGGGLQWEPALKVTFPDGNRDLVLHYVSHRPEKGGMDVTLRDIERDVRVVLHYRIDAETGILARSATIINGTKDPVLIEQAEAAAWMLPHGTDYVLHYLTGRWSGEWQQQTHRITPGETVLESRIGSTSHVVNPWFSIGRNAAVNEVSGDVWFGELGWSGSWRITVEQDALQHVRIVGGYNSFDFGYQLKSGESLETPIFYAGHTDKGYGEAARLLHRFQLVNILPGAPKPRVRPVLYNSWEATTFHVTEAGQIALAEKAASLGVERFVMDDGWFGQRKNDHAGLGDWYVNKEKFPNGLKPLIDKVHSLGMDFGLWVEPEMVNPDSDLYRKHPDWVLHFNGRPETQARNQLVLNLAMPEVRDYVFHFLDDLLSKNDIAFLKWDYNRPWSEPGWTQVSPDEQKKVYVVAINNLYSILAELRAKHPKVEIESCSSGGGRVDLGILRYTDEVWTSDNTDAYDRLAMQEGFSRAYTPAIMMAWVTDVPNGLDRRTTSLPYRFLSAMQGSLGIGNNLNKWSAEDFALGRKMVTEYKSIRETVQHGDRYLLASTLDHSPYSATESVSPDKKQAVLFSYLHSSEDGYQYPRLFLQGLDPSAQYAMHSIEGKMDASTPTTASGAYWMHHGVDISMRGDFQAAAFVFERK